ncbi:hypothetical protein D7V67_16165 [Clostridium paraputrificum]|uniref:zinc ribbon domain-containing protein n=1 Tax=Clostridium paraputrificum TaxID=29363 RepID=UPI000EA180D1|nr:zinc ribbon domain-containing protein [Clostridium paraputrificum]RKI45546.1 hypothetical protein D7V67_16165 [Clostridium paraputrificum]
MNKCPRCENENLKEHYNYCPVCGVNLGTALEVPVQEQYEFSSKCNICSYENELKVTRRINPKFCMNCGEKVTYQSNLLP